MKKPTFVSKLQVTLPRPTPRQALHPLSKTRRKVVAQEFRQMIEEYQRTHPYWVLSATLLTYLDYLDS